MRLALQLGKSLEEVHAMSLDELEYWIAFSDLEPFGDEWRQTATIARMGILPWLQEGQEAPSIEDFMPMTRDDEPLNGGEEDRLKLLSMFTSNGISIAGAFSEPPTK